MQTFSIAAQSVTLADGLQLHFRVNPVDSSQCEIHVAGRSPSHSAIEGTHVITFKRNGGEASRDFVPTQAKPTPQERIEQMPDGGPKTELKQRMDAADAQDKLDAGGEVVERKHLTSPDHPGSVDDDALRATPDNRERFEGNPMDTKVSPVHGKINTAGADNNPVKPKEGTNADTPLSDRRDQAAVGLKPAPDRG